MSERVHLTESAVAKLEFQKTGQRRVLDTRLESFFVVVGTRTKSFAVQMDVGDVGRRRTRRKVLGRFGQVSAKEARAAALEWLSQAANGKVRANGRLTLRQAWEEYRRRLEFRRRSPRTVQSYGYAIEDMLAAWLDQPLARIVEDGNLVARRHEELTGERGPIAANRCMRAFRAVARHARRIDESLPDNPVRYVEFNRERSCDRSLDRETAPIWYRQLREVGRENPVRVCLHWFTLLSAARAGSVRSAKWEHLDVKRRVLLIPAPKGGEEYAYEIPLSRPMLRCLTEARRAGRACHPLEAREWIFPANSRTGHVVAHREERNRLSHWGHDLRRSWATIAQAAGVDDYESRVLMNHTISNVHDRYKVRGALVHHLREVQERVSAEILAWCGVRPVAERRAGVHRKDRASRAWASAVRLRTEGRPTRSSASKTPAGAVPGTADG